MSSWLDSFEAFDSEEYCKRTIDCNLMYNSFKWEQKIPVVTITDWDEWNIGLLSSI